MTVEILKRTPLYDRHVSLGAKIVPFAGWEMPVQYSGIIEEHVAVRERAGLFDVSHMGEIIFQGQNAEASLDALTCNSVSGMKDGTAQYNAIINPDGGVVDDIIIYRRRSGDYLVCVNASNTDKDFDWFTRHDRFGAEIVNESSRFGQIAIQGPAAGKIMGSMPGLEEIASLFYFTFREAVLCGIPVTVARTGYTGEDGFEIFIPVDHTGMIWDELLEAGKSRGLIPCGLGARDTLRLEACYPLHGHELGDDISAYESGLGWIIKLDKGEFMGRDALAAQKSKGLGRALVAFEMDDPGIAREHTPLFDEKGGEVGYATSGTRTPTLNRSVGMALVKRELGAVGTKLHADVRGRRLACHVASWPLYRTSSPAPSAK